MDRVRSVKGLLVQHKEGTSFNILHVVTECGDLLQLKEKETENEAIECSVWLKMGLEKASGKGPKDRPLNSREVVRTNDEALSTVTPINQQTDGLYRE